MLGVLINNSYDGPAGVLKDPAVAATTPTPSPSTVSSDFATALPSWLLVSLLAVVTLVIVATFALTAYSLSAPRSTLKNIIGRNRKRRRRWFGFGRAEGSAQPDAAQLPPPGTVTADLVRTLATSARSGKRTTRTTLAIVGFSLLGVVVVAIFGLSGQGVRDLRSQVIAAITTLVATIAGFYFGADAAQNAGGQGGPAAVAPGLLADPTNPAFVVGRPGTYTPKVTGTPPPTVSLSQGTLPSSLQLNPATGVISGTPASGTENTYAITLTAANGIVPDATLPLTLTVSATPVTMAPGLEADPTNPTFVVGQPGIYTPKVTGAPPPAVSVSQGSLPPDLAIDPATGIISGTPAPGTENTYTITLTAANSVVPDATLSLTLTVSASS